MRRIVLLLLLVTGTALAQPREEQPVRVVAPTFLAIPTQAGQAILPVYTTLDWARPQRFTRGHNYWAMLQARHGVALQHTLIDVPGIAHEGNRMFTSSCGLHVLFGAEGC